MEQVGMFFVAVAGIAGLAQSIYIWLNGTG